MDPQSNSNSGLGLPQPGNDMGPLPPIRTPQAFHAPDTAASHFEATAPSAPSIAPPPAPNVPAAQSAPAPVAAAIAPAQAPPAQMPAPLPAATAPQTSASSAAPAAGPVDDDDTAFDEEWVNRAREVVSKTHSDPFVQSQELSKLKAQYIKLRYNKDIKVSE